jgi:hypothetical protein
MKGEFMLGTRFAGKWKGIMLKWLLIVSMIGGIIQPGIGLESEVSAAESAASAPKDIGGHWAEKPLSEWIAKGFIKGFQDGSARPNQIITRIEFVALVNRLFAYKGTSDITFKDVPAEAWYASEVSAAVQAGYLKGFPDGTFQPNKSLSRVEAAVMAAKLIPVMIKDGENPLDAFKDKGSVPGYGRDSLNALLESGFMKGFPDQTIGSAKPLTRAEAVVLLDRIWKQSITSADGAISPAVKTLETGGTYGPSSGLFTVAGDLAVNAPGTTLRNLVVKGNLLIGQSVGDGDVNLDHVTVLGNTSINGGGENSVHIDNSELRSVVVNREDGRIRVVVGGTTIIKQIDVQSDAIIESSETTSTGIEGVVISATGEVTLIGNFSLIEVKSDVKINVSSGTIDRLLVNEGVKASTITLNQGVQVTNMELRGTASVKGTGEIVKALVDAPNVTFETKPRSLETTGNGGSPSGNLPSSSGGGPVPPTPNPPVETAVTVTASLPSANGFRLSLSVAVPNLTAPSITLRDSTNHVVAISSVSSLTEGSSYRIAATLSEGEVYTVALAKTGYAFGNPVSFSVPNTLPQDITVTKTVQSISASGFQVSFDKPVTGLQASNFSLKHSATGEMVSIEAAVPNGEGTSYELSASLVEGVTYSLAVAKAGYSFGNPVTVFVPDTDPGTVSVTTAVYGIGADGFKVSFSQPVAGLNTVNFILLDKDSRTIPIDGASTADEGGSYAISANLAAGETYTLAIERIGYSFGTALQVTVPAEEKVVVTPSAKNVRTYGFILSMDKTLPDLDSLNFVLKNGNEENVSIDMLSAVVVGKEYEVWSTLAKNDTYTLSLEKEGYAFTEPVVLKVETVQLPSSIGWVSHGGFQIIFQDALSSLSAKDFTLEDPSGKPVAIAGVQLGADGKSAVVSADLSKEGAYRFHLETDDGRVAEGTVNVLATVAVSKYTSFDGYPGSYTGVTVHFAVPVSGLTAAAFELKDGNGNAITVPSVTTANGGSSYSLQTTQVNSGGPFTLGITAAGYSFGEPATLVNATLNVWNAGRQPTQFMAGLNPSVPNLTKDNFTAKDASGKDVAITNVEWDSRQRIYVVTFAGSGGQSYSVSAKADGYDFGAPKTIRVFAQNTIIDPSYTGFTLVMVPPVVLNTEYGFKLTRADGTPAAIQSVVTEDGGSSYKISAALAPGVYSLSVDADLDKNVFSLTVPVVATLSVDQITNNGLNVKLNYAVDGLNASHFVLVNAITGDQISILSALTEDQGSNYRLTASLPKGSYNLKLAGHLPAAGVSFQAADTITSGSTTITNVTNTGFDLSFENAVAGLLPANIIIRDAQNNKLSGLTLSTDNNGAAYHVRVGLASNADYTITLQKDYVVFDSPITFHVNRFISGSVSDVTSDGHLTLKFNPAFPEIENYLGLSLTDGDGAVYYPNLFESIDGGASYQLYAPNQLHPGTTYYIKLAKDGFSMNPISFMTPPVVTVTESSTSGLKLQLSTPIPSLDKKNFIVKSMSGETMVLTSAMTDDSGTHYTLSGTLEGGKIYTVQYKPDVTYQVNELVPFSVSKIVTAVISNVTGAGFKIQFNSKISGLTPQQVILRDPNGDRLSVAEYSLKTTDQGLSYQVTLSSALPGKGYTFDLSRDEFKIAVPVSFDISAMAYINLVGTTKNKIVVAVSPHLSDMTTEHFSLFDNKGKKVAITVTLQSGGLYNIEGEFNPAETYTLQTVYSGYTFGAPLTIGFKVRVDAIIYAPSQKGFKLKLYPPVMDLSASDITVTDEAGNIQAVATLQPTSSDGSYNVLLPLSGGKTYHVKIADKAPYVFGTLDTIKLNNKLLTVNRLSLTGFKLNFTSPLSLSYTDLSVVDDQGKPIRIESIISRDAGLTYIVDVALTAGVNYKLSFNKMGYDFGADIPLFLQTVTTSFEGMESGNNNAFTLRFDHAVPDMLASDFMIRRSGFLEAFAASKVSTEDGGNSYKVESNFWGGEQYTVLPVKDGYDFGLAVAIDVPVIVSTTVLRMGASYVDIGLNPAVPGLNANHFTLKDSAGQPLTASSVVTEDGGATYRIKASFIGGQTYSIAAAKEGYDFGAALSADLPSVIRSEIGAINEKGMTLLLTPAVGGLKASHFTLHDASGLAVAIDSVTELNGGVGYTLFAKLTAGAAYSVTPSVPGYTFGASLTAAVPIPVSIAYKDIQSEGLVVKLDRAVPGLSKGSFTIVNAQGQAVPVASATSKDGGLTYALEAALQYGGTYSLNAAKSGYDFGAGLPFAVLRPVTKSVLALTKKGFILRLQTAVPDLKESNVSLVDSSGNSAAIFSLTTTDEGLTYEAAAELKEGSAYTLSVTAQGYDFGSPLQLHVQQMLILSATEITSSGFKLNLNAAIPDLSVSLVHLTDQNGQTVTLDGNTFYDLNRNTANAGKTYTVRVPMKTGQIYLISIDDPLHPAEGPIEVLLPNVVSRQVTGADMSGITVSLGQAQLDLQAADVEIITKAGETVAVTGVVPGATAGTYTIQALLVEGSTYSLRFHKKGYDFGTAVDVNVAYRIIAQITSVNETGFTLSLTSPVSDLNLTLLDAGSPVAIGSVSTPDYGQTYRVTANMAYNKEFKLRLSKTGYDFGADLIVNHVSTAPLLIDATSSESGTQVILTFDKPLTSVYSNSTFSVKIDSQWQSSVSSVLGTDPTQIILTWNSAGRVIGSTSTVAVAYTGVNRVKAVNQTYLAAFSEAAVSNVATLLGFVASYAYKNDAAYPAQVLHKQYGKTALETAKLLRDGGFKAANIYKSVRMEYVLGSWSDIADLLYAMEADSLTIYDVLSSLGYRYINQNTEMVGYLISAGYSATEISPVLRKFGISGKELVFALKASGVSGMEMAKVLRAGFDETSGNAALLLKYTGLGKNDIAAVIQESFGLTSSDTVLALAFGQQSASDVASVIKDLYQADAVTSASWLSQAGYTASSVGDAIAQFYHFTSADEAAQTFLGAGFSASYTYSLLRREYAQKDAAAALLGANIVSRSVAEAVQSAGDAAGVMIAAMVSKNYEVKDIAIVVNDLWAATGSSLSDMMMQFATSGFNMSARAKLLREEFGSDIATAIAALYPGATREERNGMIKYLLEGGYDPVSLADYYMKHTAGGRYEAFRQLRLGGVSTTKSLQSLHDAIVKGGEPFTLKDAMQLFYNDYTNRYEAADVMAALRTAFAQNSSVTVDAASIAEAMSNAQLWDKYTIAKALINQMGVTMEQWVELARTSAFAKFGCPCAVSTVVKDTQYLFAGATLPDITVAMSLSKGYTLDLIIEGTINLYAIEGVRAKGMPYLISALKNAGYSFEVVAAEFDSKGWTEWIAVFSKYGIAASDVAAYLKKTQLSMDQVVDKLAAYPLKDRALVLRETYGLDTSAAMSVLLEQTNEDEQDIGAALAWAYGSDPIMLWIETLRSQGATATSVINTLAARYPSYWDSEKVGPALLKGGFSQDEVMKGLLVHSSVRNNLKATIGLLQQMYGQQQVTISQILKASSIDSPASGIEFLRKGGYKLPDIARSLKDYYGVAAGEAARLLTEAYPNDQAFILKGLAGVYGQTLEATVSEALAAQGIDNVDAAIDYLWNAGFGTKELADIAKEKFGLSAGQTALLFAQKRIADNNALITTISTVYSQSVESTIYGLLSQQGVTSFAEAILFVYQTHFSLATSIKLAKNGYGLSAGTALQAHLSSLLYRQSDVVAGVSNIYGSTQRESIVDSLTASHLDTLGAAVSFLQRMGFGLEGIVRVGKEHYRLNSGGTSAALITEGTFDQTDIENTVTYVYGQTLAQTTLEKLTTLGITVFADALPELKNAGLTLPDLVLAAKTYYLLTAGETTYALLQSSGYATGDILSAVAQYYGKPINQSVDELLKESGITLINDAAPYLRSMGFSLQEVIEVSKDYYGNSSMTTIEALNALSYEDSSVIEWTVLHVYSENSEKEAVSQAPQQLLQEAGITNENAAVAYLWGAGYSLVEITSLLKDYYGKPAAGAAQLLITDASFETTSVLISLNTVYGTTYDAGMVDIFKTAGIFTSAESAALLLSKGGYRLGYIAEMLKKSFGKTGTETKAILTVLGIYSSAAVQSAVEAVYDSVNTSSGTLQEALDLYGIKTAEGAVTFLSKQNTPIQDILQYLKDIYNMGADEATELLAPYNKGPELGLAVFTVYYNGTNVGYLSKIIPAGYTSSPVTVSNFMRGKFKDTDIVLALKVLFNLDALGVIDAISSTVMSPERVRAAVLEVFGDDPLFAYLKRMKAKGANANDVAAELDARGLLEAAPSSYLVNILTNLGYGNARILEMRYNYYNRQRQNEGTEEEQGTQLVQLGVNTPAAIVQYLRKWSLLPYKVIKIVQAGLPNAPIADIALAMREQGYESAAIMGGLSALGENGDTVAAILKKLGLSAMGALSYLNTRSSDDQLRWLISNGYTPAEYIRYRNVSSDNTIAILKQNGMSGNDLAKLLANLNMGFYTIAKALYDGGFTSITEVAAALLAAGCRPGWVPGYLQEIGGWTLKEIAKAMLDSNMITLADLVVALQMANGKNLKMTYQIIKEISTRERQAYYDDLNAVERKLLNNNDIAMIITVSAMRAANIKLVDVTNQLKKTDVVEPEVALKVLMLSGFNVLDATDTVWNVYRDYIGAMIILMLLKKAGGQYITDFSRYYTLIMKVSKIVYELSK